MAGWHCVYPAYDVGPCKRSAAGHKKSQDSKEIYHELYVGTSQN